MQVFAYFAVQSIDLFRVFLTLCFIYQLIHLAYIIQIKCVYFHFMEKYTRFLFILKNYILPYFSTMQFSLQIYLVIYFIKHDK